MSIRRGTFSLTTLLLLSLMLGVAVCSRLSAQSAADLQREARTSLQAEAAQEGKDCPNAKTQLDANLCFPKVLEASEHNLDAFYTSLLSLLARDAVNQKNLETAQAKWLDYRARSCEAIDYLYREGTIRNVAVASCKIQLTRSRMRDLDSVYSTVLHN